MPDCMEGVHIRLWQGILSWERYAALAIDEPISEQQNAPITIDGLASMMEDAGCAQHFVEVVAGASNRAFCISCNVVAIVRLAINVSICIYRVGTDDHCFGPFLVACVRGAHLRDVTC